ncbi:MAG: Rid family detoxifying hydrolase [Gemmatimonadota bacterium]
MTFRAVHTGDAPQPGGHYSQALVHEGLVYVSGQLPIDPATGLVIAGDITQQTEQTLDNVAAILGAAGSGLDRVLMLTVFVLTRDDWAAVNAVCVRRFGAHRPARAIVGAANLKADCRIEITAVAACDETGRSAPR